MLLTIHVLAKEGLPPQQQQQQRDAQGVGQTLRTMMLPALTLILQQRAPRCSEQVVRQTRRTTLLRPTLQLMISTKGTEQCEIRRT